MFAAVDLGVEEQDFKSNITFIYSYKLHLVYDHKMYSCLCLHVIKHQKTKQIFLACAILVRNVRYRKRKNFTTYSSLTTSLLTHTRYTPKVHTVSKMKYICIERPW